MAIVIAIVIAIIFLFILLVRTKEYYADTSQVEFDTEEEEYLPPAAFLDLETTGLYPDQGERVVEIAAIRDDYKGNKLRCFHTLINPEGKKVSKKALELHGHSNEMLADQYTFEEIAEDLADFLQGCELIAHNAPFDVEFLNAEFARVGMPRVSKICLKVTDTLKMARKMYPGQRNTLDAVATRAGLDVKKIRPSHSAKTDVKILYEVYLFLMGQKLGMKYKKGVMLRELSKW